MNSLHIFFVVALTMIFTPVSSTEIDYSERNDRILNIFSIVRFPNNPCQGTDSNGTCYSAEECSNRGGSSVGSCASGYGVCCTFEMYCGQETSENCSYFVSSGTVNSGECRLKICPCNDNICQLRLDFQTFVLNQPDTSTTSVAKIGGKSVYEKGQCQTDIFSVTSPGNNAPPVICGTNSGEHMYMDSSDACNEIAFNIGSGTSTVNRSWRIKITQYDCNYNNLAPDGCTQYFFGAVTDQVKTYNFSEGQHLANQDQNICIRRERSYCQICWAKTSNGDFETSGSLTDSAGAGKAFVRMYCCSYGTAYTKETTAYDCAIIPGAKKTGGTSINAGNYGFCGGEFAATDSATATTTICSKKVPFNIRFLSDLYESDKEVPKTPNGFRLAYILKSC